MEWPRALYWLVHLVLALIAACATMNRSSFSLFAVWFILTALAWCGVWWSIGFAYRKATPTRPLRTIPALTLLFFICCSFFMAAAIKQHDQQTLQGITPDHFRTHGFMGTCEFSGGASTKVFDPWYYVAGCDKPDAELLAIMQSSPGLQNAISQCNTFCSMFTSNQDKLVVGGYCSRQQPLWGQKLANKLPCDQITTCVNIQC